MRTLRFALFLIATTLAMAGEFTTSIGGVYPSAVSENSSPELLNLMSSSAP
jgi:hypothetical protein